MAAVFWAVLWLVGLVFALAMAALVLPVTFRLRAQSAPRPRTHVSVGLVAGLVPAFTVHDSWAAKRNEKHKAKPERPRKAKQDKAEGIPRWLPRMVRAAPRLIAGLLRPIRLMRLHLDADIGLGDPADTGQLYGAMQALLRPLRLPSGASVVVRPDFTGPRTEGTLDAEFQVAPVAFLPPLLAFGWRVFGWRR